MEVAKVSSSKCRHGMACDEPEIVKYYKLEALWVHRLVQLSCNRPKVGLAQHIKWIKEFSKRDSVFLH